MSEFKFTDKQWYFYEGIPEQAYSERSHLEAIVNRWLAKHDAEVKAEAWDEGAGRALVTLGHPPKNIAHWNPYREATK